MAFTIREGMTVVTADGERLGKVLGRQGEALVVEKGFFFPKDYLCRMTDIRDVRGDEVILSLSKAELEGGMEGRAVGGGTAATERPVRETREASLSTSARQDVSVPIVEEELQVQKRMHQAGAVRVSKEVHTEQRTVTVPVTREEVRVERVPASATARADGKFERDSITVPIMEEEVVVTKRPVVKEEVRISKQSRTENRNLSETVRKEEVKVDRGGNSGAPYKADPHSHQ